MGLNRFVLHTSVHQPLSTRAPGLSLGPFGQWFTRNETWAEQATPWVQYLARSSFMLQQGRFVADIAYFYGEDTNVTALFQQKAPPIPDGYNFDYVNADALMHQFSVSGGRLATPSGMQYRVLALDPQQPVTCRCRCCAQIREARERGRRRRRAEADWHRQASATTTRSSVAWPTSSGVPATVQASIVTAQGTVHGDATIEAVLSRAAGAAGLCLHEAEGGYDRCCSFIAHCRTATSTSSTTGRTATKTSTRRSG